MSSEEKQGKSIVGSATRKKATARCRVIPGKGRVFFNGVPVELMPIEVARLKIMEPLLLLGRDRWSSIDAYIEVQGGGIMGQAEAARVALARALVRFTGDEELENLYRSYDRYMLAGDPRRTESEKWMRYSARRWRQKSYR
ncbi:30S ribosomal protein S9 [Sulfodiicoccus acidiphilus]|uniref:Small ribosomal subunit protein uS9 n=1 Tax=Sulfodiicoccus acidiphilus TaxID=1670455 RepID=A0A348B6W9_9CREN|nr:30S ribosomal protein S9 [Sulfodiicoccus acidiphilus]BBD73921.1 30S ribosomal protein S9 [Sulfodiicoccus acidiphilus]